MRLDEEAVLEGAVAVAAFERYGSEGLGSLRLDSSGEEAAKLGWFLADLMRRGASPYDEQALYICAWNEQVGQPNMTFTRALVLQRFEGFRVFARKPVGGEGLPPLGSRLLVSAVPVR